MEDLLIPYQGKNVSFPLPEGSLPTVKLTSDEAQQYRQLEAAIVDNTVAMERDYRANPLQTTDSTDWKLAKEKEDFRVYKRLAKGQDQDQRLQPMVLCVGTIPGTIEDTLYGMYDETTDGMRAVNTIINKSHLDGAVLALMDKSSEANPFRLLSLKWRINATPGGGMLIKYRDSFNLESMGITTDSEGERFGFFVLKSIDRPDFPPFSRSIAVRSQTMFCCIFRQVNATTVGIYAKGIMNLGGDISEWFCYNYACPKMSAIVETTQCQAAKKLTALAINKVNVISYNDLVASPIRVSSRDAGLRVRGGSLAMGSTHESSNRHYFCSVCLKKGGKALMFRSSLQRCQICTERVCGKCSVKHELLGSPTNIMATCCKACVIEAKSLAIDPMALCPMVGC